LLGFRSLRLPGRTDPLVAVGGFDSDRRGVPPATNDAGWPVRGVSGGRPPGWHDKRVDGEARRTDPLVALRGLKLNPGLAVYLRRWVGEGRPGDKATPVASAEGGQPGRQWRVRDRLSEADVRELVEAFRTGTTKHELVERYGISLSSVKRVLRRCRVGLP
jgi:hypothetical protein